MKKNDDTNSKEYNTGQKTLDKLRRLEAKKDLFRHQIDEYSAWRILRFKAATEIQNLPFEKAPDYPTPDWLFERLFLFLPDLIRFLFPRKAKYVIKTFSSALREQDKGFYRDVYFDDVYEGLTDCYKIETLNNYAFRRRRRLALYPIDITTSVIDFLSSVATFLKLPPSIDSMVTIIHEEISAEPALRNLTKSRIGRTLRRFYWSKNIYTRLLKRIDPKFVMTASQNEYAIWAAAKSLGIITLEFQHGVFPSYDPDAVPSVAPEHRKSLVIPDRMLVYGEYWKKELEQNPYLDNEVVAIGKPLIDKYRAIREEYKRAHPRNPSCKILLATQGIDRQNLITFFEYFLQIAYGRIEYELIVKLHPGYEKSKRVYQKALGKYPNVQILLGNEDPSTFHLLSVVDFHVSISSTTHYDALGIGVPTIILPLISYQDVSNLADSGHAFVASTPQELLNIILEHSGSGVPPEVSAYYYAPDALNNIRRVIETF